MDNLTVIIPYRNEREALARLLCTLPSELPVIVVDDHSETPPRVPKRARVIRPLSRGYFAGAVNAGLAACDTDVLVLNQDIWFEDGDGWLAEADRLRRTYAVFGQGVAGHPAWPKGYVDGRFMFMRRDAIAKVGGFNERDFPLWGCTCEWQLRACRAGYKALPMPKLDWYRHEPRRRYGASIEAAIREEPGRKGLFIRTPPLVSVVIPSFNHGCYLPDALASLLGGASCLGEQPGQTFAAFEVIVVDDASTDDTAAIMAELADPWRGVRYIRRAANGGTPAAENTGIRASYGRFIQILAADDMLAPNALERSYRLVEADPRTVPYSDLAAMKGGKLVSHLRMGEYDFDRLLQRNMVPAGIMFAKTAWQAVGGYPESFRQGRDDWSFAVALGRAGYCGRRIPETLYYYRREGQNRTLRNTTPDWRERFAQQMREAFPDLYRGERPMGCCGGRRSNVTATTSRAAPSVPLIGSEGMALLEYVGMNVGRTYWVGPVTRARYVFSGSQRVKNVDTRDVPGMLEIIYDRRPAFRRYIPPAAPPAPKAEPAPVPEPDPDPVVLAAPEPELPMAPAIDPLPEADIARAMQPEEAPKPKRRGRPRKKQSDGAAA